MATYVPQYAQSPLQNVSAKARLLIEGYHTVHDEELARAKPMWSDIFKTRKSDKRSETSITYHGYGLAEQVDEAEPTPFKTFGDGGIKTTDNVIYKIGFMLTREAIADDLYGVTEHHSKALPNACNYRVESSCAGTLAGTFGATLGFDPVVTAGLPICSDSHNFPAGVTHLVTGASTWSNLLSSPSLPTPETIKEAVILMHQTPDRSGYPMDIHPNCIISGTTLAPTIWEILKSTAIAYSDENTANIFKDLWPMDVKVWKWLPSETAWWVADTDILDAFWQWREYPEFNDDSDYNKGVYRYYAYFRGNSDWNEPRGIVGTPGV